LGARAYCSAPSRLVIGGRNSEALWPDGLGVSFCGEGLIALRRLRIKLSEIQKLKFFFPLPDFLSFPSGCPDAIARLRDRGRKQSPQRLANDSVGNQAF